MAQPMELLMRTTTMLPSTTEEGSEEQTEQESGNNNGIGTGTTSTTLAEEEETASASIGLSMSTMATGGDTGQLEGGSAEEENLMNQRPIAPIPPNSVNFLFFA